jgi:hypothetical protein
MNANTEIVETPVVDTPVETLFDPHMLEEIMSDARVMPDMPNLVYTCKECHGDIRALDEYSVPHCSDKNNVRVIEGCDSIVRGDSTECKACGDPATHTMIFRWYCRLPQDEIERGRMDYYSWVRLAVCTECAPHHDMKVVTGRDYWEAVEKAQAGISECISQNMRTFIGMVETKAETRGYEEIARDARALSEHQCWFSYKDISKNRCLALSTAAKWIELMGSPHLPYEGYDPGFVYPHMERPEYSTRNVQ